MNDADRRLSKILDLVNEIDAIIILDMPAISEPWSKQIDKIYDAVEQIRALCGDDEDGGNPNQ